MLISNFRTYGTKRIIKDFTYQYDERICYFEHTVCNKPAVGLWASPIRGESTPWRDFCLENDYRLKSLNDYVDFTLEPKTKVLFLRNEMDADIAYRRYGLGVNSQLCRCLNWERIEKDFDAVYFLASGFLYNSKYDFSMWDVDSLVVFNLKKIKCL